MKRYPYGYVRRGPKRPHGDKSCNCKTPGQKRRVHGSGKKWA